MLKGDYDEVLLSLVICDYFDKNKVIIDRENDVVLDKVSYDEMLSLIKAGNDFLSSKSVKFAKDKNKVIEIRGKDNIINTIISSEESNKNILYISKDKEEIKVVFKNMDVFNQIFNNLVENKIKLEELVIIKNIVYIKGKTDDILKIYDFCEEYKKATD